MKKKVIGLVCGIVIVALLAVSILLLIKTEPADKDGVSSVVSQTVSLIKKDEDILKDITVKNEKGGFRIEKAGESFVINELKKYDRFEDNYNQIIQYVTDLSAKQLVDKSPKNFEKYGLESPKAIVTARYTDGSSFELSVGNKAPDDESYYVKKGGEDAVYLLSEAKTARFLDDRLDYVSPVVTSNDNFETETVTNEDGEQEEQQVTPEINSFTIIRDDLDLPIKFVPAKKRYSNDELSSLECIYQLTEPFNANLDSDKGKEPVSLFYAITAQSVADIQLNEEKYSRYGFKNPTMKLIMDAKKKKYAHELTVGAPIKDKKGETLYYYCIIDDNDVVYKVAADDLSWRTLNVNDILAEYIINPVLDEVSSVAVNIGGKDYKFSVTGKSAASDKGSLTETGNDIDIEPTNKDTVKIRYNKKTISTSKFRDFYVFLNSLTSTGVVDKAPTGAPAMTITYSYRDSRRKSDVVELIPYGNNKVAVSLNGDVHLAARSAYIDRAKENIEKLINNKEINAYW